MNWIGKMAVVALGITCACSAQKASRRPSASSVVWEPPTIDWPDNLPRSTVPKEMIGSLRIANLPVILEKTSLEDAQKRFGGTIGNRGDAGDSEAWLCLHGSDASGPWIFWLTSGEIDGPAIGGFQWRRLSPNETPDRRCRLPRKADSVIELPLALHPGITEAEARKILGRLTVTLGKTVFFLHEHEETIHNLPYTSENSLAVVFRDGTILAIEGSKTTAN